MYTHIFSEIRSKMNKMSEADIFVRYQSSRQYRIFNPRKGVVETSTAVEFYETHPEGPLLNQEPEEGELEPSKAESDTDEDTSAPQNGPGASNDVSGLNTMPETIIEGGDAPVSTRNEGKKEDLPTSAGENAPKMGGDLSISVGGDLPTSVEVGDLQAGNDLQNPVKAGENRANDLILQTPSEPAVGRSSRRGRRPKKVLPTAASSRPRREKRAYDSKAFDKEKAPVANEIIDRIKESKTYQKAITGPHKEQWKEAIRVQLLTLISEGTWMRKTLPKSKNLVTAKWVFKVKYRQDGIVERFKARLVARGFTQKYGIDYKETFAPTL